MASALKIVAGAATEAAWLIACRISWTSGSFWQIVPMRFHMKATASRRSTSAPALARSSTMPRMARKTSGFSQFRSHWKLLKVVQTHLPRSSSQVKLPGAWSGKTSSSVSSYCSGIVASS